MSTWVSRPRRLPRQLEREPDDPGDLVLGVGQRVERGPGAGLAGRLGPVAEVDPAGQLADDQHVDAREQLRAERRRAGQRRVDGHRPQVGEQAEAATQGEERLLRAGPPRPGRTTSGPPTAPEQDRVGRAAGGQVLVADGDPVRVDGGAADEVLRPVDGEAEALAGRVDDPARRRDDLRPDAVARDGRDPVRSARPRPVAHGVDSPLRGEAKATDTPLISAPWSLLTATT